MDELGKWLQHDFEKPLRTATPVTSLYVVENGAYNELTTEITTADFAHGESYSYTGNELTAEMDRDKRRSGRGVIVHVNAHGAQPPRKTQIFRFGAPSRRFLEVGGYGGAGGADGPNPVSPYMTPGGGRRFRGEFVVWECEVRGQRIIRLAIDFIGGGCFGSLRVNSLFQPTARR
jgi:hypothetical protein